MKSELFPCMVHDAQARHGKRTARKGGCGINCLGIPDASLAHRHSAFITHQLHVGCQAVFRLVANSRQCGDF